ETSNIRRSAESIWLMLNESEAIVVDFTNRPPNVDLEYGMALVSGKPIVALTQRADDIPSNTPNLKYSSPIGPYRSNSALFGLRSKLFLKRHPGRGFRDARRVTARPLLQHRARPLIRQDLRERLVQLRQAVAGDEVLVHLVAALVTQDALFERGLAAVADRGRRDLARGRELVGGDAGREGDLDFVVLLGRALGQVVLFALGEVEHGLGFGADDARAHEQHAAGGAGVAGGGEGVAHHELLRRVVGVLDHEVADRVLVEVERQDRVEVPATRLLVEAGDRAAEVGGELAGAHFAHFAFQRAVVFQRQFRRAIEAARLGRVRGKRDELSPLAGDDEAAAALQVHRQESERDVRMRGIEEQQALRRRVQTLRRG